jgi:hypothetical protein
MRYPSWDNTLFTCMLVAFVLGLIYLSVGEYQGSQICGVVCALVGMLRTHLKVTYLEDRITKLAGVWRSEAVKLRATHRSGYEGLRAHTVAETITLCADQMTGDPVEHAAEKRTAL